MVRHRRKRSKGSHSTPPTQPDELLRYNLVAFVDLIGQSTLIRSLTALPETDDEKKAAIEVLKATVGRVRGFRECFNQFFSAIKKGTGILDRLPPEMAKQARQIRRSAVRMRGFSDSVIIDLSLAGDDEGCTAINGVYATLVAIAGTFPEIMGIGVPLRAGVDVGIGIDVEKGELYGAALERAHSLEAHTADWSRIAVGEELVRYLESRINAPQNSIRAQYATSMARSCRGLIAKDEDGTFILDYLGPGMDAIGMTTRPEAIQALRTTIEAQLREHAGNEKLEPRWQHVRDYVDSRRGSSGGV